ncbi:regulatory protein RecX [Anaerosalibacter sp. Marseille-P3206]|uniref:regulatory protein RecX n=1 Tax=Anaerosalibacter sp. Marseille-P3206 TaxID=1871005 RepID=UPI000984D7DC|nr:RecX family transcriptional regulator [Anaerosalibacter sp. Marseille-P3206]
MKITKIQSQRDVNRVNIYIDEKFAFGLSIEIAYKYNLEKNMEIDEEYIENVLKAEEQDRANNYAIKLLSYRWRSEKEIRDKMIEKGYEIDVIDNTVDYLYRQNLLNDKRFAQTLARDKINLNKWGSYRIKQDLYMKGISKDIIDEVLDEYCDDEYERAMILAKKKITSYKKDDKNATYRKLGGFLQRKGYSYDCVSRILKELLG